MSSWTKSFWSRTATGSGCWPTLTTVKLSYSLYFKVYNTFSVDQSMAVTLPVLLGFRDEYPGGGIYRHQFEQWTGNVVMNIVFR